MAEKHIAIELRAMTDRGLVRPRNEDTLLLHDLSSDEPFPSTSVEPREIGARGGILAVLDGMGGAASGDVASRLGADVVLDVMRSARASSLEALAEALGQAAMEAHGAIRRRADADEECEGMGTTLLAVAFVETAMVGVHVGDCRAYLLRNERLQPITRDQSLFQELFVAGDLSEEEEAEGLHSNVILQALGVNERIFPHVFQLELQRDDVLLLCSDGLTDLVPVDDVEVMVRNGLGDIGELCESLIERAKARGGHDNVSVVLARFSGDGLRGSACEGASRDVEPRTLSVSSIPSARMAAMRDYALLALVLIAMAILTGLMVWVGG